MSAAVVQDADTQAELQATMDQALGDLADPTEIIEASMQRGFDGEIHFIGERFRAKVCIYEAKMAWVYCSTHQEHLGHVLERDAGLGSSMLTNAMNQAKRTHRKLGEWLVGEGVLTMPRLRTCLETHLGAHLRALAFTTGAYELEFVAQRHRYDHALTFDLEAVVTTAVFARVRGALEIADALAIVEPAARRVVAMHHETPADFASDFVELAARADRFAGHVGIAAADSVFRTPRAVYCLQPLRTHPRLWLGIATTDLAKIGLMLERAAALEGTI